MQDNLIRNSPGEKIILNLVEGFLIPSSTASLKYILLVMRPERPVDSSLSCWYLLRRDFIFTVAMINTASVFHLTFRVR